MQHLHIRWILCLQRGGQLMCQGGLAGARASVDHDHRRVPPGSPIDRSRRRGRVAVLPQLADPHQPVDEVRRQGIVLVPAHNGAHLSAPGAGRRPSARRRPTPGRGRPHRSSS
ncbi:hypothetical protein SDC9_197855 [bioreactor metagenome]|uniref:Uncharacterized protein n=1 Tax=bioreactor metagenome TaxID=1076179 RepID=A0A645IIC0_9ZZZZ